MNEEVPIDQKLTRLCERIAANDEGGVQDAIFDLGAGCNGHWKAVPDEVVDGILALLRDPSMFDSHLAGMF